jgi:hypothetical protein
MSGPKQYLPVLFLILGLGIFLNCFQCARLPESTSPQSFEEVAKIAKKLGLHCRSDRGNGEAGLRLLISEGPLPRERDHLLRFGSREESEKGRLNWLGVAAVYHPWNFDSDLATPWGRFFVYGDPDMIEKLTGLKSGQS